MEGLEEIFSILIKCIVIIINSEYNKSKNQGLLSMPYFGL